MDHDDNTRRITQLQHWDLDEPRARRQHELMLAAEAHHRLRVLSSDWSEVEHLAQQCIELLRASNRKTTG